jgi:hypothetical protein
MRKFMALAAFAGVLGVAGSAAAAVVADDPSATRGGITIEALPAGADLTNNGPFSSGGRTTPMLYVLDEGLNLAGDHTFLMHFDRSGTIFNSGRVAGSFDFELGAGDVFLDAFTDTADLLASDDTSNGAHYQRCLACTSVAATLFRGLEPSKFPVFGDVISIVPDQTVTNNASHYTVYYDFTNDGATMDEARFVFGHGAAVPEPASWALMIAGFGLAGATLRSRKRATASA